jgi:D-alanyl-D-alanine carboxypeptidase-like protein
LQPWARWLISRWPYGQLTSTLRSFEEQTRLYDLYLRGAARYPAAPPGSSMHEVGRAFDYYAPDYVLEQLGDIWTAVGGTWGGAVDPIHFEA